MHIGRRRMPTCNSVLKLKHDCWYSKNVMPISKVVLHILTRLCNCPLVMVLVDLMIYRRPNTRDHWHPTTICSLNLTCNLKSEANLKFIEKDARRGMHTYVAFTNVYCNESNDLFISLSFMGRRLRRRKFA